MSEASTFQKGMSRVAELNATQGSLLGFLHEGPLTGWDLIRRVEGGLSRFWNVTSSHVYRELRVLEERGLIQAGNPGVRDRVPFAITGAGRREFRHWIRRPPASEQIRFPLLVSLWFGRHLDPARIAEFVDDAHGEHTLRLNLYESLEEQVNNQHHRAVIRFGVLYERAVLSWLEELERLGETS
jgi:DNA-binding PadR family transcriptional regulator